MLPSLRLAPLLVLALVIGCGCEGTITGVPPPVVPVGAPYLVAIHNRIHVTVADEFLRFLSNLPSRHPPNQDYSATVEVVLDKSAGKIVRLRLIKSSGETAFDLAALQAFERAQPFGQAPDGLASADGNVYVQWEIRRDPYDLCTTRNARLFYAAGAPPPSTAGSDAGVAPPAAR